MAIIYIFCALYLIFNTSWHIEKSVHNTFFTKNNKPIILFASLATIFQKCEFYSIHILKATTLENFAYISAPTEVSYINYYSNCYECL